MSDEKSRAPPLTKTRIGKFPQNHIKNILGCMSPIAFLLSVACLLLFHNVLKMEAITSML